MAELGGAILAFIEISTAKRPGEGGEGRKFPISRNSSHAEPTALCTILKENRHERFDPDQRDALSEF
jgi:hypothetical protein